MEELIKSEIVEQLSINCFFKDFRYALQNIYWSVVVEITIITFFVDGNNFRNIFF